MNDPKILLGTLRNDALKGKTILVTGAGRGIGFEAAKSVLHLGGNAILAEIDEENGRSAEKALRERFGEARALFVRTDVGDEESILNLKAAGEAFFGKVDAVLNNATLFSMGTVIDKPIKEWDRSYSVNLRGPVLLARAFLLGMIERGSGVFACVSSSGAAPYMGAYEVLKTAQVELANTLAGELEGKNVFVYTIGPGIVQTPGFLDGGAQVAKLMGITMDQLLEMNKAHQLSPEEAGAGFAASIALAERYNGQEVSCLQVLRDAGILTDSAGKIGRKQLDPVEASEIAGRILRTFTEQSEGWRKRNLFERQWITRDFKKSTGYSPDDMHSKLQEIQGVLKGGKAPGDSSDTLKKLESYWIHQQELLRGYERDKAKLESSLKTMDAWVKDLRDLIALLSAQ